MYLNLKKGPIYNSFLVTESGQSFFTKKAKMLIGRLFSFLCVYFLIELFFQSVDNIKMMRPFLNSVL